MDDIRLSPRDVWTPDLELFNNREKKLLATETNDRVVVGMRGRMTWIPPYLLTASCKFDPTWFPFDEQRCTFKIGSWTYNGFKLNLQLVSRLTLCCVVIVKVCE